MKLNLKTLQTLAKIAPKNEIRHYLNGVHVVAKGRNMRYEATNGHWLIIAHELRDENDTEVCDVIVPRDFALTMKFGKSKSGAFDYCDFVVDGADVAISYYGNQYRAQAIDGKFPNVQKIFPRTVSGKVAQFNPSYVATVSQAMMDISGSKSPPILEHNGDGPSRLIMQTVVSVIMPMRAGAPYDVPEWVFGDDAPTAATAEPEPHEKAIAA